VGRYLLPIDTRAGFCPNSVLRRAAEAESRLRGAARNLGNGHNLSYQVLDSRMRLAIPAHPGNCAEQQCGSWTAAKELRTIGSWTADMPGKGGC
jgi:hypothetical protein